MMLVVLVYATQWIFKAVLRSKESPITGGLLNSPLWLVFLVKGLMLGRKRLWQFVARLAGRKLAEHWVVCTVLFISLCLR